jgi:serine/threonine-protein phosphatase 2A regulatory subunit A
MRRLFVVANAIGRDETLTKLIPTLTHHIKDSADQSANMSHAAAVPTGQEEDDEILLIMAEQLGQMVQCGLIPGYRATVILPILEQLAGVEETVVREKAVESLNTILPLMMAEGVSVKGKEEEEARQSCVRTAPGLIINMIKRMAGADWFTAKVSACAVLPSAYQFFNCMKSNSTVHLGPLLDEQDGGLGLGDSQNQGGVSVEEVKAELRNIYRLLTEDETPMVRRGAGKSLACFVEAVAKLPYGKKGPNGGPITREFIFPGGNGKDEQMIKKTVSQDLKNKVYEEIVPLYQALSVDEQDSVRLLAVSASGSVGCALGLDAGICSQVVLPIIKAGSADLSW